MKTALWLAWREIVSRRASFIAGMAFVAVATMVCTATELVWKARAASVRAEIDRMGPAVRLVPRGKSQLDLLRFNMNGDVLPTDAVRRLEQQLHPFVRVLEKRLLMKEIVEGVEVGIVGIEPESTFSHWNPSTRPNGTNVVLGAGLAAKLMKEQGDIVRMKGNNFRVGAILPERGDGDDFALFVSLKRLQSILGEPGAVNEVEIFPRNSASFERITSLLEPNQLGIHILVTDRGTIAEHEVEDSLRRHRLSVYQVTAIVMLLCVLVWSFLNAKERTVEISSVVAMGATTTKVLMLLSTRAVLVGISGAVAGYGVGASVALLLGTELTPWDIWSTSLFLSMIGAAVGLSVVGGVPASIFSAFRDHVAALQY